jgi:hypothetical protein
LWALCCGYDAGEIFVLEHAPDIECERAEIDGDEDNSRD